MLVIFLQTWGSCNFQQYISMRNNMPGKMIPINQFRRQHWAWSYEVSLHLNFDRIDLSFVRSTDFSMIFQSGSWPQGRQSKRQWDVQRTRYVERSDYSVFSSKIQPKNLIILHNTISSIRVSPRRVDRSTHACNIPHFFTSRIIRARFQNRPRAITCTRSGHVSSVGVPQREKIKSSCSVSVDPGRTGLPCRSSARIHPTDHISTSGPYCWCNNTKKREKATEHRHVAKKRKTSVFASICKSQGLSPPRPRLNNQQHPPLWYAAALLEVDTIKWSLLECDDSDRRRKSGPTPSHRPSAKETIGKEKKLTPHIFVETTGLALVHTMNMFTVLRNFEDRNFVLW